jgi:hypothetical protein
MKYKVLFKIGARKGSVIIEARDRKEAYHGLMMISPDALLKFCTTDGSETVTQIGISEVDSTTKADFVTAEMVVERGYFNDSK